MKTFHVFILSILCFGFLNAQFVKGVVLDAKTSNGLAGAHIYFNNSEGVVTDDAGNFKFRINRKTVQTIFISHLNFETQSIDVSNADNELFKIYLQPVNTRLSEMVIETGSKKDKIAFNKLEPMSKALYSFGADIKNGKIYVAGGDNTISTPNPVQYVNELGWPSRMSFTGGVNSSNFDPNFNDFLVSYRTSPRNVENINDKLFVYDINTNSWNTEQNKLRKRDAHNLHIFNDELYVIGGKNSALTSSKKYLDNVIEVYNLNNQKLQKDMTNPSQAVNFASVVFKDYLITLGGVTKINKNGSRNYSDEIYFQNLRTGYWYKLGKMPNPKEAKGVLLNNKIYLVGGFNARPLNTIESYDLESGEWTQEGELFKSSARPGLAVNGHMMYIYDNGRLSTYNTLTGILNEYQISLNLNAAELFYKDNKLYLLGGYTLDRYIKAPSNRLYEIDINEFYTTKIAASKKLNWNKGLVSN